MYFTRMNFSSWFEKVYPDLSGSGLWLRGNETNTIPAAEWDVRPFRVLLARLSTYRDAADSFTHRLLHQIIDRAGGMYPDLAYLPPPKDGDLFVRDGVPWLLGTTSKRPVGDFDIIAFSLSIVQELLNIAPMLGKSGIPLSKRDRMADPSCPLIILGGASALYSSFLFGIDSPVDGIFVGEDAGTIARLFRTCSEGKSAGHTKGQILESLCTIPGFFLPDGKIATRVFHANPLSKEQLLEAGPIPFDEGNIGKASLQISEGCTCSCNFCAESFSRKPYREFPAKQLRAAALRLKAGMGVDDLELYSFNFSMHREFYLILGELAPLFPAIGLKSQRLDSIARDPAILKFLHALGKASITCGIEGISLRLRRYLNKDLDENDIGTGLHALLSAPLRELKIFLIATGLEQDDDYEEFRKLLSLMNEIMQGSGRRPRIIFSMTLLVRFPWTPLEFEDAPSPGICSQVLRTTERLVHAAGFEFRSSASIPEYRLSQLLVRISNPDEAAAVRTVCDTAGFVYYREIPMSLITEIERELDRCGIGTEPPFKGFLPENRPGKPWSGIETGVNPDYLVRQWEQAREERTEDRGKRIEERGKTSPSQEKASPTGPKAHYSIDQFKAMLADGQTREKPVHFRMQIGAQLRGVPAAMRGVALARALLLTDGTLSAGYRGDRGSLVARRFGSPWIIGDDIISLAWNQGTVDALCCRLADPDFIKEVNRRLAPTETLIGMAGSDQAEPARIEFLSPFQFDPTEYCRLRSIKFTFCKTAQDCREYRLSPDALKKGFLTRCLAERLPDGSEIATIFPGPKFMPDEFAQRAFLFPERDEWVRTVITMHFT